MNKEKNNLVEFWDKFSFENTFGNSSTTYNFKSLVNVITKYYYTNESHALLIKADAYAYDYLINDGIDIFKEHYNFKMNGPSTFYMIFITYLMEKMLIYSKDNGVINFFTKKKCILLV